MIVIIGINRAVIVFLNILDFNIGIGIRPCAYKMPILLLPVYAGLMAAFTAWVIYFHRISSLRDYITPSVNPEILNIGNTASRCSIPFAEFWKILRKIHINKDFYERIDILLQYEILV